MLRQRMLKTEENAMKQKEFSQDRKLSELAMSATEQINKRVEKSLNLNWICYYPKRSR